MVERAPVPTTSWPRRIGWLVLIWAASVIAVGLVALLFRVVMSLAGLTP